MYSTSVGFHLCMCVSTQSKVSRVLKAFDLIHHQISGVVSINRRLFLDDVLGDLYSHRRVECLQSEGPTQERFGAAG